MLFKSTQLCPLFVAFFIVSTLWGAESSMHTPRSVASGANNFELRGMLSFDGEYSLSLHDCQRHSSAWVAVGGYAFGGYLQSFDPETLTAVFSFDGSEHKIQMRHEDAAILYAKVEDLPALALKHWREKAEAKHESAALVLSRYQSFQRAVLRRRTTGAGVASSGQSSSSSSGGKDAVSDASETRIARANQESERPLRVNTLPLVNSSLTLTEKTERKRFGTF